MKQPVLVVMAAGMGSRYGGLKQIDPVGAHGEIIIDFSLYDAWRAGFRKVIFIIKKAIEADFREVIGERISKIFDVEYAFQEVEDLPDGFSVPEGRGKPWGTGHAVLACRKLADAPFAVINADDYYGAHAFQLIYDFLLHHQEEEERYRYAMVGYRLENTLTDHGHVARGVCSLTADGNLADIVERTRIEKCADGAQFTEDGEHWTSLPVGSTVSMNLWGFTPSILRELEVRFPLWLSGALVENPLKSEFFLPTVVDNLLKEQKATVKVLTSADRWYGVTYREDKPVVEAAIAKLHAEGVYPEYLWEGIQHD
ncbi:MAG: sugar phosphate nucleotidyltransferase [Angelakisella sp.]